AAAARVAAAAAREAVAAAAARAAAAAAGHHRHLFARQALVVLLVEPALLVGAALRDVGHALAPVGGRVDDLLVDGHPRAVLWAFVGADRHPDDNVDDDADHQRNPSRAAAGGEER